MGFDVTAWLKDLGFSDEEQTALLPQFSTREGELEKGQLRQSDYSKVQNDFKAEMTAAREKQATADAKLNAELAEWSKVQAAGPAAEAAAATRIAGLEQQLLTGRQRIEQIAQTAGLDAAEYLKDLELSGRPAPADPAKPADPNAAKPPDLTGYVKVDDVAKINDYLFQTTMALPGIAAEHQALTGEPLDTAALGVEIQRRAHAGEVFTPRDVWEALYDIPAKRATAAEATAKARDEQNFQRGREAAISEAVLPVGAPAGKHAVIFQPDGEGKPRESALERPQPNVRTDSAVQALVAHKYRPEEGPPGASGKPSGAP